jgi:hypothetical protein
MTTPTKTKKTKTAKPIAHEKATECIALGQLLQDHENSLITIEEAINAHACEIDDIKESLALFNDSLARLKHEEIYELKGDIHSIFWVAAIGFSIAIPLSVWAITH